MTDKLELETEFDAMLAPLRRRVFRFIGVLGAVLIPGEAVMIFGFLSDRGAVKLATFHGAILGFGGLVVFSLGLMIALMPTKLMAYKGYKKSCEAAESCKRMEDYAKESRDSAARMESNMTATLADVRASAKCVPGKLDKIAEAVGADPIIIEKVR